MSTVQIPAEHLAIFEATDDDHLTKLREHNAKRARQDWAEGCRDDARRWYAYVDTIQAILDRRHGIAAHNTPAPVLLASPAQVNYIANLLVRREGHAGFSGLVDGLADKAGNPIISKIQALAVDQASQVIDSLTERY